MALIFKLKIWTFISKIFFYKSEHFHVLLDLSRVDPPVFTWRALSKFLSNERFDFSWEASFEWLYLSGLIWVASFEGSHLKGPIWESLFERFERYLLRGSVWRVLFFRVTVWQSPSDELHLSPFERCLLKSPIWKDPFERFLLSFQRNQFDDLVGHAGESANRRSSRLISATS